ncbi:hypothetical protein ACFH04_09395 [Streptomyces noboritoensis]|uniref:Uncharacterized protein n=1 Tax=Streptomyces noboritoensis TaxID=67337 RepID=A0ABV6TDT1_9ACTN
MHGTDTGRSSALPEVATTSSAPTVATPPFVAQVVPLRRDVTYDHKTQTARMPVEVQFADGSTVRTDLLMNPSQLHAASIQIERAITTREAARFSPLGPL